MHLAGGRRWSCLLQRRKSWLLSREGPMGGCGKDPPWHNQWGGRGRPASLSPFPLPNGLPGSSNKNATLRAYPHYLGTVPLPVLFCYLLTPGCAASVLGSLFSWYYPQAWWPGCPVAVTPSIQPHHSQAIRPTPNVWRTNSRTMCRGNKQLMAAMITALLSFGCFFLPPIQTPRLHVKWIKTPYLVLKPTSLYLWDLRQALASFLPVSQSTLLAARMIFPKCRKAHLSPLIWNNLISPTALGKVRLTGQAQKTLCDLGCPLPSILNLSPRHGHTLHALPTRVL